jgi:hypothetical protein
MIHEEEQRAEEEVRKLKAENEKKLKLEQDKAAEEARM